MPTVSFANNRNPNFSIEPQQTRYHDATATQEAIAKVEADL